MPQVSVVIPFRNSDGYIADCLQSVVAQTLSDLEVICVDNGSTDRSRSFAEQFCARDKRLLLISCHQTGAGHARNAGMAVAQGDFLAFVDADDVLPHRTSLERLYLGALASGSDLTRGNVYITEGGVKATAPLTTLGVMLWWRTEVVTTYDEDALLWLPVQHQAYLIRRRFVEAHRLTYPGLLRGQDAPFLLQALLKANSVHCSSEVCYAYRKGHRGHVVLDGTHLLADFLKSALEVRDLLIRCGRVRQWHLVLARTCSYLRRVCSPDYLVSEARLRTLLCTLLEDCSSLGALDYCPYRIDGALADVRTLTRLVGDPA